MSSEKSWHIWCARHCTQRHQPFNWKQNWSLLVGRCLNLSKHGWLLRRKHWPKCSSPHHDCMFCRTAFEKLENCVACRLHTALNSHPNKQTNTNSNKKPESSNFRNVCDKMCLLIHPMEPHFSDILRHEPQRNRNAGLCRCMKTATKTVWNWQRNEWPERKINFANLINYSTLLFVQ